MSARPRFREMVEMTIKIVANEGEISIARLAFMLNVSPSVASYILRAAAELDSRILYVRGRALWQDGDARNG